MSIVDIKAAFPDYFTIQSLKVEERQDLNVQPFISKTPTVLALEGVHHHGNWGFIEFVELTPLVSFNDALALLVLRVQLRHEELVARDNEVIKRAERAAAAPRKRTTSARKPSTRSKTK